MPRLSYRGVGEILLITALVGYPLVTIPATVFDLPSRWVTVPYRLIVALVAVVLVVWGLNRKERGLQLAWWMLPFFAFWSLYLLRLSIDTMGATVHLSRPLWEYWAYALGTGMLPALGLAVAARDIPVNPARSRLTFALAIGLIGLIALGPGLHSIGEGRFYLNPFLNPISGAHYAVMFFLVALWTLVAGRIRSATSIAMLAIATVCVVWVQTLSASRGPMVVLGLGLGLIALSSFGPRRMLRVGAAILLSLLALVAFQSLAPVTLRPMAAMERLMRTGERVGRDQEARVVLWDSAWQEFLQSPLLGVSLEDPSFPGYPHNIIFEAFLSTGLVGGVCVVILILLTFMRATYWVLVDEEKGWLGLVGIQMLVWAMFSGALYARPETWAMMGLILGYDGRTLLSSRRRPSYSVRRSSESISARPPDRLSRIPDR